MFENIKMKKEEKKMKNRIRLLQKRMMVMLKEGTDRVEITKKAEAVGWSKKTIDGIFQQIEEKKKEEKEITIKVPFLKKEVEEPKEEKEEQKKGLVSQLTELNEKIDIISQKGKQENKLKKKKFKIPFKVKSQLKKLAVKNKVQVMLLQRTRNIKPVIGEIRDGMLLINDQVYNGAVNSTWLWNGKIPTHLVPEWDLQPLTPEGIKKMTATTTLSPNELYKDCILNKRSAEPQKIIIRAIEAKQNAMLKPKANMKAIILTIVVVIIIMAVLFGRGVV